MIKIPLQWFLLLIVMVSADSEDENDSFERIDINSVDFNEYTNRHGSQELNRESSPESSRGGSHGNSNDVDIHEGNHDNSRGSSNSPETNKSLASAHSHGSAHSHKNANSHDSANTRGSARRSGNDSVSGAGYGFYRSMGTQGHWEDTRRVFGGAAARLEDFPEICALLDRFMSARCSGSVLTPYWILTAAHCISSNLAYAKFNTRTPLRANDGQIVPLRYLYKHPDYKVVQEDLGQGMDVTVLHHDMGLAQTRAPMVLALRSAVQPLVAMFTINSKDLRGQDVQVLGYGRTEVAEQGEELLSVQLQLVECERGTWRHCVCGMARAHDAPSGVCSGDSGGPVVYRGVQVGVTSMGPLECSAANVTWPAHATSVFTAVYPYRDIINRTINDAESSLRRAKIAAALAAPLVAPPLAVMLTATTMLYLIM